MVRRADHKVTFIVFSMSCFIAGAYTPTGTLIAWPQETAPNTHPVEERPPSIVNAPAELPEETPEEELSPAALQLNLPNTSPLIRELYQATRETKENDILARLQEAKTLIDSGIDLKSTDAQGRTALHWAVFGSSYTTKQKVIVAYEEVADAMIKRGVDINREDIYQNTALDYLLYSPNFEMQTLLVENGATSGFLAAFYHFSDQGTKVASQPMPPDAGQSANAYLAPGATLSIRLDVPVYSDRSRTGDPIDGTITYPLCKNGEQLECKDGELVVAPGTKANGTILFAQKAPDKYSRPRLVLDFSNIVHRDGQNSPLYARVINVDNARETVQNNEILGIIQPHAKSKVSLVLSVVGVVNPIAGYTIKGVQTVYGLSIRREILFPAGTDVQVQVVRPSTLRQREPWAGWQQLPVDATLQRLVEAAPLRTSTPGKIPSDLTNLMFLGTEQELIAAFGEAGWIAADSVNARTALKAVQATIRQTGYSDAPVSTLLLEGRPPDLVFQKSLNTFAKRHHIRIWKMAQRYQGRDVWVGAATHDIATMNSRAATKWTHRIDPHVDRERDWVMTDLLFVGTANGYVDVDRPSAPKKIKNATGDNILTDGKLSVLELRPAGPLSARGR
ncbi:MAG TPA: LssY C-terminal domain-containing protein [Terriglobales bacterium]|nr:LssY C-terminal domain-containing protein [Terriglobales bacterium]